MENGSLSISIPLDDDGYTELYCDFCKTRFMITGDDFENKDMPFFFCPICGLPNDVINFYSPEVIQKAEQMAMEWAMKEINRTLGVTCKDISKSSFLKMDLKMPKKEPEKELYKPVDDYIIHKTQCCQMRVKLHELDEQIGVYCPICGGTEI